MLQILTQIGSDVPKMSELRDHVMDAVAPMWKNLGYHLGCIQSDRLMIIDGGYPGDSKKCCTAMFKRWLAVDKTASWDKLIAVLRSIGHNALAEEIYAKTSKGGVRRYIHSTT